MPWSRSDPAAGLRALGVAGGDVLMVHASLRAIGPVPEGAAGVVAALEQAVGPTGTLLMVLGARDDFGWVDQRPEAERAALLRDAPAFDKERTPADPDVGALAEVFRRLPGTAVNDHPDGRFGARGRLAGQLLAEPLPWDDYYGPGSPLDRFVRAGGKVLRLGADENTVTLLHLAEYLADLPAKRRVVRHRKVVTRDGSAAVRRVSCLDDTNGVVDRPGEDYFARCLRHHLADGHGARGRVGAAASELLDAAELLDHGVRWMSEQLAPAS